MAKNTTSRKLYDMLVSRGFDPEESNSQGSNVIDPTEADMVKFDYIAPSGTNYGTVIILLGDDGDLSMFFGDEKGKMMEPDDRAHWFEFLQDMKPWANWNQRDFRAYNMAQLKHHLASMRKSLNESLFESLQGNARISWTAPAHESRLVIHHSQKLGENDKRYRHIDRIFIENADGERFKLPFKNLAGAKAMLEHVRHGGTPYDLRGGHIIEMVNELNVLSRFRRAHQGKLFEGEAANLIEQANVYYESLKRDLKHLNSSRGYNRYFESWNPMQVSDSDIMVEDLKTMFIEQTLDTRIETALPVLAKLQAQRSSMSELNEFVDWTEKLTEGTWKVPQTPQELNKLQKLMSAPLPVTADAIDVTELLYDLFGDDAMFDELIALSMRDPNADSRPVIQKYMERLGIELPQPAEQSPQQPAPQTVEPQQPAPQTDPQQPPVQEMLEWPKVTEANIGDKRAVLPLALKIFEAYEKIHNLGATGLEILDFNGKLYKELAEKYNYDLDEIIDNEPIPVLYELAKELEEIADLAMYDLRGDVNEDEITDPKEIGAKINPAYISPAARAGMKSNPDVSAPAPAKIGVTTTAVPDVKFEDIERIKSLVSYLNH